ncbi:Retrovirus-related Pol polyprotein from transposon 412 [Frankliniella fusca]|uniref:RNA-directed DNA polymerase n=1 Tax=Frankliniella fusca TaxID=407009 RepID=A0AAE1LJW9_9NEOP|nr:Retrovirus-related Pol polyprotein from transposon 412 [Frankliniella fusca]
MTDPPLQPSGLRARVAIMSCNDSSDLLGPRLVRLSLGGSSINFHVFEADTHDDCLLGADFVAAHVRTFDVAKDELILRDGRRIRMTRSSVPVPRQPVSVRVVSAERVVVPAGAEISVAVSVVGCDVVGRGVGVASASSRSHGPEDERRVVTQPTAQAFPPHLVGLAVGEDSVRRRERVPPQRSNSSDAQLLLAGICTVSGIDCTAHRVQLPPGLEVMSSLMAGDNAEVVVTVRNTGTHPRALHRGRCVLRLHMGASASASTMSAAPTTGCTVGLPPPLEELLNNCTANLTAAEAMQDAGGPSLAEICSAQTTDLDIAPILLGLQRGERPSSESMAHRGERSKALWLQWNSLEIKNGAVYRRFEDSWGRHTILQLVVPHAHVPSVLRQFHDAPGFGGHLGINKTLKKIRFKYYWPGMYQDTKLWCLSCERCRRKKGPGTYDRAPMRVHTVGVPWERVAVDIAGPFPTTSSGQRYLLVAVDYFTRWPEAIPIPSLHAEVVAKALVTNIFSRFGSPCELHSDQGRSFESAVFKSVLNVMGIRKTRTTPMRPQSDGAAERLVKSVVTQLSMFVNTNANDWDLQVPLVMLSLRVSPHVTNGVSPAMMLFGRELNVPPSLARGLPPEAPDISSRLQYPVWLRDRLHGLHHHVRDRALAASLRHKERYDIRAKRPTFAVGDLVWMFRPVRRLGQCSKLQCWWTGPFKITHLLNDVTARVVLVSNPRKRPCVVHVDKLSKVVTRSR